MLKSLGPLNPIVQPLQLPQVLEKVQKTRVRVGAVVGVLRAVVVDQSIGRDVLVYNYGWHADAKPREVVGDVVLIADTGELEPVLWRGDVSGRGNVVSEAAVFVEVDDQERAVPVFGFADRVVKVLDHHFARGHAGGGVHGVHGTAFGVYVRELRERAGFEVGVELVGVLEFGHGVVLHVFVHVGVDDVGFVVVLPGDALLVESFEDGRGASGAGDIRKPSGSLVGVVYHAAGTARCGKLSVRIRRTWVLGVVAIPEAEVRCKSSECRAFFGIICLNDKGSVSRRCVVFVALTLDEAPHSRSVVLAGLPGLVDLVRGSGEVVIWVYERDFRLVRTGADLQWLAIDRPSMRQWCPMLQMLRLCSPIGVGIVVTVLDVAQIINIWMEIPVSGDVVKTMIFLH